MELKFKIVFFWLLVAGGESCRELQDPLSLASVLQEHKEFYESSFTKEDSSFYIGNNGIRAVYFVDTAALGSQFIKTFNRNKQYGHFFYYRGNSGFRKYSFYCGDSLAASYQFLFNSKGVFKTKFGSPLVRTENLNSITRRYFFSVFGYDSLQVFEIHMQDTNKCDGLEVSESMPYLQQLDLPADTLDRVFYLKLFRGGYLAKEYTIDVESG